MGMGQRAPCKERQTRECCGVLGKRRQVPSDRIFEKLTVNFSSRLSLRGGEVPGREWNSSGPTGS